MVKSCFVIVNVWAYFHLVLSLGTSAQLSVIVDAGNIDTNVLTANFPALSVVPYTKEKHVVTAASLNGE